MGVTARVAVGVLASGRGSNLGALIAAASKPAFPARIACVISNRADAGALAIASAAGIEARAVPHAPFGADRTAHEAALDATLRASGCELVCLAGYMRVLTPWLIDRWAGRLLNIHPSLLPAFPGLDTHRRALDAGVALHGCSVHLVTEAVDGGPILGQAAVPVRDDDTADSLAARVLEAEHVLYPAILAALLGEGGLFEASSPLFAAGRALAATRVTRPDPATPIP